MKLQPTAFYILCSVHTESTSSLIIPETAEQTLYARILAVGPDCSTAVIGSRVLFLPTDLLYADTIDGEKLIIIPESSIFATITD